MNFVRYPIHIDLRRERAESPIEIDDDIYECLY